MCLLCTWWQASVMCPFFKDVRNPVYLALAVLSFTWRRSNRSPNRSPLFHPALLCFLALIVVSTLWAVNPKDAALRAIGLLMAFVFIWNLLRATDLTRIAVWLADGLLYASYVTIVLIAVGGGTPEAVAGGGRWTLPGDLEATGTAAMCLWALVRLFAEGMSQKGKRRIFHFILAAVALLAMLRTGTRGTLIELAVALPLLATIRLPMKNVASLAMRYVLLNFVMVGVGMAIWASLGEDTQSSYMALFRIDKNDGALDTRSSTWMPAMEKARERPWLGRGFGSSSFFMLTDEEYKGFDSTKMAYRTTVHSQYVEVFYEFGVLGFLVFAWLLVALLQNVIRIYSYRGPYSLLWRIVAIYAVVGVIEGLTHGGQITTGELNLLQRWSLYCCVLSFPLAWSQLKYPLAMLRPATRLRASRRKQIKILQPASMALANDKAYTGARRIWPKTSSCRRMRI